MGVSKGGLPPFKGNRLVFGWQLGLVTMAQNGNSVTPLLIIGAATGSSVTVRPDQLKPVSGTGNPSQFYSNPVLCEPFAGTPVGNPSIPDCATTPNAAFAVKIGLPSGQLFKTLVAQGDRHDICMAVIPADTELDLKALAVASGNRKIHLVPVRELQKLTGYIRGGVTALAAKKAYPVYADRVSNDST